MDKKIIRKLASELYISLSLEEEAEFLEQFADFKNQAELLNSVPGIDKAEPMVFPFSSENTYLREDEVEETLPVSEILSNAKGAKDGFVIVPKVVK